MQAWIAIVLQILPVLLARVPKAAPIADEVAAAVVETEQALGPGTGRQKLDHVTNVAREAAQAVDELRGQADEVAGIVREIVDKAIPLVNVIDEHLRKPQIPGSPT